MASSGVLSDRCMPPSLKSKINGWSVTRLEEMQQQQRWKCTAPHVPWLKTQHFQDKLHIEEAIIDKVKKWAKRLMPILTFAIYRNKLRGKWNANNENHHFCNTFNKTKVQTPTDSYTGMIYNSKKCTNSNKKLWKQKKERKAKRKNGKLLFEGLINLSSLVG